MATAGLLWRSLAGCRYSSYAANNARLLKRVEELRQPPVYNLSSSVTEKLGRNLHRRENHPLSIIKSEIEKHMMATNRSFAVFDNLDPIVDCFSNFDSLLIPKDHVSRAPQDTFYISDNHCLRTHTSAHQVELIKKGNHAFLCTGDVYRRDTVDKSHFPIFHQMEGVYIAKKNNSANMSAHLLETLQGLAKHLFGSVEMRWVDAHFPFTTPSYELEIFYENQWLEVLGCGVVQPGVLDNAAAGWSGEYEGWAFGLGLERLAMVLFNISDIRLFWTEDPRFVRQFDSRRDFRQIKFEPYSKYPVCYKDIAFWIPPTFHENDFHGVVRDVARDMVENVALVDAFVHPKTGRKSLCFRITYRSMERTLENKEVDAVQEHVRTTARDVLDVELR